MPNGRLSEVVAVLTDDAYRAQLLPTMRELERLVWQQFGALTAPRQNQIALPVLNQLDVVLGDDYLATCMREGATNWHRLRAVAGAAAGRDPR